MDIDKRAQRILEVTKEFIIGKDMDCHLIQDINTLDCNAENGKIILQIVYPKNPDKEWKDICLELGEYELNMCEEYFEYYTLTPMMKRFQEFIASKR